MEIYEKFKLRRERMKAYKSLPHYRKYRYFNILMKTFLGLLILSLLFAFLVKLINAQVNGNGIPSQFWLGPHGEIVALDGSNCLCNASYLWDFIANIFLLTVIPSIGALFLIFCGFNYWIKNILAKIIRNSPNNPFFWAAEKTF